MPNPGPASWSNSSVLVEFRRLQDENEFLRAEVERLNAEKANSHDSAQFFAQRYDDCAIESRYLQAELDKRPPAVGFLGRLRYLVGR
jgi:hypothetical protein